jgi:hypothetical protein
MIDGLRTLDLTSVAKRTDWNTQEAQPIPIMRQSVPLSNQSQKHSVNTDDRPSVPLDVFYVVQTSSGAVGNRQHRVCPPLYEMRRQAEVKLTHLQTAASGRGTYSIWKATTYVEPAEWLYDVVVADGSVIRARHGELRRSATATECKGPVAECAVGG